MFYLLLIKKLLYNYRRNSSALTRSVSEMNLKTPSSNSFDKLKSRGNDSTMKVKPNGTIGQQKNLKSK